MRWLIVTSAVVASLALVSSGAARTSHATNFPSAGVVVPGQSIGGIQIGMTQAQVKAAWGPGYQVCPEAACGSQLTWLYEYPGQDAALGAAVKFSTPAGATPASGPSYASLEKTALADAQAAAKAKTAELKAAKTAGTSAAKLASLKAAAKAAAAKAATAALKAKAASSGSSSSTAATSGGVVAVFTLGSPVGWGIKGQIMMGDPVSNVYNLFGSPATDNCIGYSALTVRIGNSTTAFYSANGVIYGFALTGPSQSPCQ